MLSYTIIKANLTFLPDETLESWIFAAVENSFVAYGQILFVALKCNRFDVAHVTFNSKENSEERYAMLARTFYEIVREMEAGCSDLEKGQIKTAKTEERNIWFGKVVDWFRGIGVIHHLLQYANNESSTSTPTWHILSILEIFGLLSMNEAQQLNLIRGKRNLDAQMATQDANTTSTQSVGQCRMWSQMNHNTDNTNHPYLICDGAGENSHRKMRYSSED